MRLELCADQEQERADQFLARQVEELSRAAAQRLLETGQVQRNGKPLRKNDRLHQGDVLSVLLPEPQPIEALPEAIPLEIVYEDQDVIVVNKPVGMVVHPAPGHESGTLVNALLHHCGETLSGVGGALRPGIVHRIDRDTSGLIIVAKNDHAHQSLSEQLKDHSLYREYEAVVVGGMPEQEGAIDAPIGRHSRDRKRMAIDRVNGRPAVTHWKVLARYPGYSHVQCRLETGRTHQIRVHFASVGHFVLGDPVYGSKKPVPGLVGQCLHARRLGFRHPVSGEQMELSCPLPAYFEAVLRRIQT